MSQSPLLILNLKDALAGVLNGFSFLFSSLQIPTVSKEELKTDDRHSIKGSTHRMPAQQNVIVEQKMLAIAAKINEQFAV